MKTAKVKDPNGNEHVIPAEEVEHFKNKEGWSVVGSKEPAKKPAAKTTTKK